MNVRRIIALLVLTGMLAACGTKSSLALKPGQELPPAPYGREARLTPNELLQPPTLAVPERSVELRTRSEEREDDPYDLPPPE